MLGVASQARVLLGGTRAKQLRGGAGLLELLGGESLSQPAAARVRGIVIGTGSVWCFLCTAHDAGSRPRPHSELLILFGIDGLRAGSSSHPVRSSMPCVGPQLIGRRFWPALGLPRPSTSPPRIISHTYARARSRLPRSLMPRPTPVAGRASAVHRRLGAGSEAVASSAAGAALATGMLLRRRAGCGRLQAPSPPWCLTAAAAPTCAGLTCMSCTVVCHQHPFIHNHS